MDPQTVLENAGKGMETLQGVVGNLSSTVQDPQIQKGLHALGNVGDLAKSVPTLLKGTGLALGAGLLGWGGYNMLRDWLNYRRVKSEREAKQRPTVAPQLKLAANFIDAARGVAKWLVPAAMGGGEWYLNKDEDPLVQAVAAGSGLASGRFLSGGLKIRTPAAPVLTGKLTSAANVRALAAHAANVASVEMKNKLLGLAKPPAAVLGLALPRAISHLMHSNTGMKQDHTMKPWLYGGAAAGGVGALYLLNKWINKPAPEPPKLNSAEFAGGAGGPDNPNVGGKIRVTLPTRKPGDHETTVEVPMENIGLPNTLFTNIRRDTKRRLRTETEARTMRRGPGGALVAPHGMS